MTTTNTLLAMPSQLQCYLIPSDALTKSLVMNHELWPTVNAQTETEKAKQVQPQASFLFRPSFLSSS